MTLTLLDQPSPSAQTPQTPHETPDRRTPPHETPDRRTPPHETPDRRTPPHLRPADLFFAALLALVVVAAAFGFAPLPPI